jgi:hypothetical protein
MSVKVVKGAVMVEGAISAETLPLLKAKMKNRTRLELWRATLPTLAFLSDLTPLEHLSVVNCKVTDASALGEIEGLRSLFLNGSSFKEGLGFLADVRDVEELDLLNLRGTFSVPALTALRRLSRVRVWGCKGFTDVAALAAAPHLAAVELVDVGLEPHTLGPLLEHGSLRFLDAQFGTVARQRRFAELLAQSGKEAYPGHVSSRELE